MPSGIPASGRTRGASRAVQYIRMSTDRQEYSPVVQRSVNEEYAQKHGLNIVGVYEDSGISGLTLRERPALMRLLLDVQKPKRRFDVVLVYDVSRWGRFQDVDESAYHEYLCRRAGVDVRYCAENFENDGSPASCIFKTVKRAMAGEFSRELSKKVFLAQCLGASRGFHVGGRPGYGLRRQLVDAERRVKCVLERNEYKSVQAYRTVMAPGPANEVALVRKLFEWFGSDKLSAEHIAQRLNSFGICNDSGRPWQAQSILRILRSERYIGTNIYNQTSSKLDGRWMRVPSCEWVRLPGAFEAIVDRKVFDAVQCRMAARRYQSSAAEVALGLKKLLARTGILSQKTIRKDARAPSIEEVMRHFGGLIAAYKAIGYESRWSFEHFYRKRVALDLERRCMEIILAELRSAGHSAEYEPHTSTMCVNGELRVQIVTRTTRFTPTRSPFWTARWPDCFPVDVLVFGRTDAEATEYLDFHVFPRGVLKPGEEVILFKDDSSRFGAFRHPDLKVLLGMVARRPLEVINEKQLSHQRGTGQRKNPESPRSRKATASGHH